jgi:hypothetical protein
VREALRRGQPDPQAGESAGARSRDDPPELGPRAPGGPQDLGDPVDELLTVAMAPGPGNRGDRPSVLGYELAIRRFVRFQVGETPAA